MVIRHRGKIKWKPAYFMPEQFKMLREARIEDLKVSKPISDDYQSEEIEKNPISDGIYKKGKNSSLRNLLISLFGKMNQIGVSYTNSNLLMFAAKRYLKS
ncbi:YolD-like family protein [Neobacillus terrae]|uniref:YolD-like family protein n=1 Tax=Neobacillus terrae TaxID=3034837 RepID=UPI001409BA3F|nr:YolD-like family protein [Neobacillus terrae]NHM33257.1 YolD-like family protein [Neobacillus terrae]